MPDVQVGMPKKVFTLALMMGAHGDCLVASYDDCCSDCRDFLTTAFDLTYGQPGSRPLGDVLDELFTDMNEDRGV